MKIAKVARGTPCNFLRTLPMMDGIRKHAIFFFFFWVFWLRPKVHLHRHTTINKEVTTGRKSYCFILHRRIQPFNIGTRTFRWENLVGGDFDRFAAYQHISVLNSVMMSKSFQSNMKILKIKYFGKLKSIKILTKQMWIFLASKDLGQGILCKPNMT